MASRLKGFYETDVIAAMRERFGYANPMEVPRLEKIVINMGVGDAVQDPKQLENSVADLQMITGQKPALRRSTKSISNFKLRAGMAVGCMVTLRGERMYDFLDRLVSFALPQVRDFRGVSPKSFDGRGNFNMGLREQVIFPEMNYDKIDQVRGMNVTMVTSARTDEEARVLLRLLGIPFSQN